MQKTPETLGQQCAAVPVDDKRRTIEHHPLVPRGSKLMAVNRGDKVWVQLMENGCLNCGASGAKRGLEVKTAPQSRDFSEDLALKNKTMEEVSKGWSAGPYSRKELNQIYGRGNRMSAKRFGLMQSAAGKKKLRVIDDYSAQGQNGLTTPSERLDHGGLVEVTR
eukprot:6218650-Amphidinium_carterae.1